MNVYGHAFKVVERAGHAEHNSDIISLKFRYVRPSRDHFPVGACNVPAFGTSKAQNAWFDWLDSNRGGAVLLTSLEGMCLGRPDQYYTSRLIRHENGLYQLQLISAVQDGLHRVLLRLRPQEEGRRHGASAPPL
jgi:hypothetical protein